MPKAALLSETERAVIISHHAYGESPIAIASLTGRHDTTIHRFLQSPQIQKPVRTHKPKKKLSDRDVRYLRQDAIRTKKKLRRDLKES